MFYIGLNNIRTVANRNNLCCKVLSVYSLLKYSNKTPQNFVEKADGSIQKKKKTIVPKITLIAQDDSLSITTLEEAQRLSKRRELKLVKIVEFDMKTHRPVYKLMTGSEYLAEDLKQREERKLEKANSPIKGEKVLILSSNISEHDLKVQVNKILKWLSKSYEVRTVINGVAGNPEAAENICRFLEKDIGGSGQITKKRSKGNDVKFQLSPPKKNKENQQNS